MNVYSLHGHTHTDSTCYTYVEITEWDISESVELTTEYYTDIIYIYMKVVIEQHSILLFQQHADANAWKVVNTAL